ncbi:MAG: flagellar hook-associated protein FlgL [Leptospirillia bacterium]
MSLRVPDSNLQDSALFYLGKNQQSLFALEQQIASGKRVHSPVDDAVSYVRAKDLRDVLTQVDQYKRNLNRSEDHVSVTESALSTMEGVLQRAKEIAISQANATIDASQRATMAVEMQDIIDELVVLGNTQLEGRYVFAGSKTGTAPYNAAGVYGGDALARNVEIGDGVTTQVNTTGDEIFNPAGGTATFTELIALRDALQNNNVPNIQAAIDNLDPAIEQVTKARMVNGFRLKRIDTQRDTLEDIGLQTRTILSDQEDIDMASAISEMIQQQTTLEATRATLGRILSSRSLLDFMG